jgi:hypothetical protein
MHVTSWRFRLLVVLGTLALLASVFATGASGSGRAGFDTTNAGITQAERVKATFVKDGVRPGSWPTGKNGMKSVIVKLDVPSVASVADGGPSGLNIRSAAAQRQLAVNRAAIQRFSQSLAAAVPSAKVTARYDVVYGGAAVMLPRTSIQRLLGVPGVVSVRPDTLQQLQTDVSPTFIGAKTIWRALGGVSKAGEGVIVGVLDSGVWPEHPSYSDPDPAGKPYPAPPPTISGTRQCEFTGGANPGPAFACNNKLIGADRFMATYDAVVGLLPSEYTTARDDNGHGTHTSSTAAGNRNVSASIFGIPRGVISGVAPRAHVMAYKVCGNSGCFQSDSVAAVQKAIQDNVNVINFSISGGANPFADAVELAFLDAYNAGIFVAASAGNSGPTAETVDHRGPWVTTVGASTSNRHFRTTVSLAASGGDTLAVTGSSVTTALGSPTPVVNAADAPTNDTFCLSSTADGAYAGKAVVCQRGGGIGRLQKSYNVQQRGGVAMLLYNPTPQGENTDNMWVPSVHLDNTAGSALLAFLAGHTGVTASFPASTAQAVQGDVVAPFSSRGGPAQPLGVSKPDIVAPGVQILAGNTPTPATVLGGPPGQLFQAIQGTSMSSPHIAGSAALVKDLHPTWTPGQIKSALMTTAKSDNVTNIDGSLAGVFDRGSGRVRLQRAGQPGATLDVPGADFTAFQNELYRTNYPSFYHPSFPGAMTVQRTLHSVIATGATYTLSSTGPSDLDITTPPSVFVPAGGNGTFNIAIDARDVPDGGVRTAFLKATRGKRSLTIPITIVRGQAPVRLSKTCAPGNVPLHTDTTCTLTIENPLFTASNVSLTDNLPARLSLVPGSATGGATEVGNGITYNASVPASSPPNVAIAPGSSPAGGYLPLSLFGIPPVAGVGDDTITNFNVPAFSFAGNTYSQVGFSSNGYVVIGGGSGPDNSINNQNFPDANRPNNTLALFWTDLNPAAAGAMRIGTLTDGSDTWIVMDWQGVREFSTAGNLHSFQVWIGVNSDANPGEDVSYAYGPNTGAGDGGFTSVGAENLFGNRGQNTYFNGTGTLPTNGTQLRVTGTPGVSSSHTITFMAEGVSLGNYVNYAEMTADTFFGTNIRRFAGKVVP